MYLNLNSCEWKLKGYWPYEPLLHTGVEIGNELLGVTEWIEATVPGGVHVDLFKAGIIEDPYFEANSLKCEWIENRWWKYSTRFSVNRPGSGRKLRLVFKGVDYKAHFYLNGEKLGEHEGMYELVVFDVTQKLKFDAENQLSVLLESPPKEMGQFGYTSRTKTQKSRFNYKWDFCTRMVNIGLWDDVFIQDSGEITLGDTWVKSDVEQGAAKIGVSSRIRGKAGETCEIFVDIDFEDRNICSYEETRNLTMDEEEFSGTFFIDNPRLWYTNGCGGQPLYKVGLRVLHKNEVSFREEYNTGIRKLEYRRNENSPEDSLPYTIVINSRPVYIKGVNLTPFDVLYGTVTKDTYDRYFHLLKIANINLVRVWGGGLIEKDYFYQLCDRYGIMVWQEFIQSSSGIENVPSTDPHFIKLLRSTAVFAVKSRRNYISHTVWSGGNELRGEDETPVTYDHPNIRMLKEIVEEYDAGKLFLPSSASGPNEFLDSDIPGTNHDVHGSWKYEGTEKHYRIFNRSDSLLHSEFGVDGCSSAHSLVNFLSEENRKIASVKDNMVWRLHGEWWETLDRDTGIFGRMESLDQYVKCSQFIQAEGLRYALESNRRRKFRNSGSIVWQFNEPWPNIFCTNLVDYYGVPKMAYYWVKNAYAPIHASLRYEKLNYRPDENFAGSVYVHNSLESRELKVLIEILDIQGGKISAEKMNVKAASNSTGKVKDISFKLPKLPSEVFFIRLQVWGNPGQELCRNIYLFSQRDEEIFSPFLQCEKGELRIERNDNSFAIKNQGRQVCLFIHGTPGNEENDIVFGENYITLFPGEEQIIPFSVVRKTAAGESAKVDWDCLGGIKDDEGE